MNTSGHLAKGAQRESLLPAQSQAIRVLNERTRRTKHPSRRAIANMNIENPPKSVVRVCVRLGLISVDFGRDTVSWAWLWREETVDRWWMRETEAWRTWRHINTEPMAKGIARDSRNKPLDYQWTELLVFTQLDLTYENFPERLASSWNVARAPISGCCHSQLEYSMKRNSNISGCYERFVSIISRLGHSCARWEEVRLPESAVNFSPWSSRDRLVIWFPVMVSSM